MPEARGGAVRVGCSGWNYKHWREIFYPKGLPPRRWLERYASCFDTVEINNTFYRLPPPETVEGWAAQAPYRRPLIPQLITVDLTPHYWEGVQPLVQPLPMGSKAPA